MLRVPKELAGCRVDRFLQHQLPGMPFVLATRLLKKRGVTLTRADGSRTKSLSGSLRLRYGDSLRLSPHWVETYPVSPPATVSSPKTTVNLPILYQDECMVVINKPPGIPSQGGSKQSNSIDTLLPNCLLVHRLDMGTSGVMVLAKNSVSASAIAKCFASTNVHKEYLAVLCGTPTAMEGSIRMPVGNKPARTDYTVVSTSVNGCCLVRFTPTSGRKHQIRIHARFGLGYNIVGDQRYLSAVSSRNMLRFPRVALHCSRLRFPNPSCAIDREMIDISAHCPEDLLALMSSLNLPYTKCISNVPPTP